MGIALTGLGEQRLTDIRSLAPSKFDRLESHRSSGYLPFFPQENAPRARNAVFINAGANEPQLQYDHSAVGAVREAGVYFITNAIVTGHGFVVVADSLVVDQSVPSQISVQFAKNEGLFEQVIRRDVIKTDYDVLAIAGPGYPIWGHWLLDFLPRIYLAQCVLGCGLARYRIPLPTDTPDWVFGMAKFFCGLDLSHFILFDRMKEAVKSEGLTVVPEYLHTDYFLHSALGRFYSRFVAPTRRDLPGKVCISRRKFTAGRSVMRNFPARVLFEETAQRYGYQLVHPETLSFREQIDLFSNATSVVGEYGSGMHNTLFSRDLITVGQFVMPSPIQSRIAGLRNHSSVFLLADNAPRFDSAEVASMEISEQSIIDFFETMEATSSESIRLTRRQGVGALKRSDVVQSFLDLYSQPRYLEIGVNQGETFLKLKAAEKVAVGPKFHFDTHVSAAADPTSSFFEAQSDRYFGELHDGRKFDVIYLDGLHTLEQTLRDFCNSVAHLKEDGVIIVDDILPNSYYAALPDLATAERLKMALNPTEPDMSWMGDVYKLVFFVSTFFQSFSYACVQDNHGQMVVWRERRGDSEIVHRTVGSVGILPYEAVVLEKDAFKWLPAAEIVGRVDAARERRVNAAS